MKFARPKIYSIIISNFMILLLLLIVLTEIQKIEESYSQSNKVLENLTDSAFSLDYQIKTSGNNILVIWQDFDNLYLISSRDNGESFTEPINLSNNSKNYINDPDVYEYQFSISGNNVYVIWDGFANSIGRGIYLTRSTDNGASFEEPLKIVNTDYLIGAPQLSIYGNNVYVTWANHTFNSLTEEVKSTQIWFTRSTDSGTSFEEPKRLHETIVGHSPRIASFDQKVYVIWEDNSKANYIDIWFTRSADNGASFEKSSRLSESESHLRADVSEVFADKDNLYVVWQDDTTGQFFTKRIPDVMFTRSTDNGASFEEPKKLDNEDKGYSISPHLIASNNNVFVAWSNITDFPLGGEYYSDDRDYSIKSHDIMFTRSTDNGASFEEPKKLDKMIPTLETKGILLTEPPTYLTEDDISENDTLYHIDQLKFNIERNINDPHLCISKDSLYIIWLDNIRENYVSADVFFTKSTNNGSSFEEPKNLSNNNSTKLSYDPQVSISDEYLYISWIDINLSKTYEIQNADLVLSSIKINNNSISHEGKSMCKEDIKFDYPDNSPKFDW